MGVTNKFIKIFLSDKRVNVNETAKHYKEKQPREYKQVSLKYNFQLTDF